MQFIYILVILINMIIRVAGKEYVPALIWTSREFYRRRNTDYLVLKKIKSDLFESYITEVLDGKKPLIMVFLEQNLNIEDFEWKDEKGDNSFPFLSNLTVTSRVDYFRSVESPHQTVVRFASKGFEWKNLKPGTKFITNEGEIRVLEFKEDATSRPELMKSHDKIIEEVHKQLAVSGILWISIYTAKHSNNRVYISDLMQLSPWHVEKQLQDSLFKVVSLYRDESTGFTLIIKGSIQLYLPSPKNLALKTLDNYLRASAIPSSNNMDFVIWFSNYTLTFHLSEQKGEWAIVGAELLNKNGNILKLAPRQDMFLKSKCYVQLTEFQNEGKPIVKMKLSKYKFLKLPIYEGPCIKPYRFHLTLLLILAFLACAVICWNWLTQNLKFPKKSKVVRVSIHEIMSLISETMSHDT